MSDGPPNEDRAISTFLDYLALACIFGVVEAAVIGKWKIALATLAAAVVFHVTGIKWSKIKLKVGTPVAEGMARVAGSRVLRGIAYVSLVILLISGVGFGFYHRYHSAKQVTARNHGSDNIASHSQQTTGEQQPSPTVNAVQEKKPTVVRPKITKQHQQVPVSAAKEEPIGPSQPPPFPIPVIPDSFPSVNGHSVQHGGGITIAGSTDTTIKNNRMMGGVRVVPGGDSTGNKIIHNQTGNSVLQNAGKVEGGEVSRNIVRGDHASAVNNDQTGDIKNLKIQDNDIGQSMPPAASSTTLNHVDWHDKQNWRKFVKVGMTRTKVRQLFGEPAEVSVMGDMESWEYGQGLITSR